MAEPTTYIVLRLVKGPDPGEEAWAACGTALAANTDAAIRKVLEDLSSSAVNGTYVAVPARSFRPVAVQTFQTTTLKLDQLADVSSPG